MPNVRHAGRRGVGMAVALVAACALAACSSSGAQQASVPATAAATGSASADAALSAAVPAGYDGTDSGHFKVLAAPEVKPGTSFKVGFLNTNASQPILLAMQQAAQAETVKLGGSFIALDAASRLPGAGPDSRTGVERMTEPDVRRAVGGFLRRGGLLGPGEADPKLTPLAGGVSSDLWRADLPLGPVCVKSALPQLKVAREWHAPTSRNRVECDWLRFAQPLAPGQIPRVLAHDERACLFAMEYLPPGRYPVWKTLLLAGQVDVEAAREVGDLAGKLHAASAVDPAAAALFATDENFDALRITPYLLVTAQAHPDLRHRLAGLAARTAGTHLTVVHGDVSPKNILLGPDGPVLLDAECAWYGDPAFDVAFCVNHLLIKSVKVPAAAAALRDAAGALAAAHVRHVRWEPADRLDARIASLAPALALARVDGSSPVEYLSEAERAVVRSAARGLLIEPPATVRELVDRWAVLTADRKESPR